MDILIQSNHNRFIQFQDVIIDSLAYITPANICSEKIHYTYKHKAKEMVRVILNELPNFETYYNTHGLQVVQHMLLKMWDDTKFHELLGTNLDYLGDEYTIDCEIFDRSLEFIQVPTFSIHISLILQTTFMYHLSRKFPTVMIS